MKAITIKQPWASLIAHGIKDIENRTWKTNYRGKVLIHAGNQKKFNIALTDEQCIKASPVLAEAVKGTMPFGAIIGEVKIIDCVLCHNSIWAEHAKNGTSKQIWNWVLTKPVLYDVPIENVKGKLSFWDYNIQTK